MKTREQLYRKEAAELLRDLTTYHYMRRDQILRLYPERESKIENLLTYFTRQSRIFYDKDLCFKRESPSSKILWAMPGCSLTSK